MVPIVEDLSDVHACKKKLQVFTQCFSGYHEIPASLLSGFQHL